MSLFAILVLILFWGAIGGFISGFARIELINREAIEEEIRSISFWITLFVKVLLGVGGAVSMLLVLTWMSKFNKDDTVENKVFLISLSMVSGFIGHRLLPRIAARLEEHIASEVKKETAPIEKKMDLISAYQSTINRAAGVLAGIKHPLDCEMAIKSLLSLKDKFATDRVIYVTFLGRLYKALKRYDDAIGILTEFIKNKQSKGEASDIDYADAHYNRACYQALKWQTAGKDEKIKLQHQIADDLRLSCSIFPDNRTAAHSDRDFDAVRGEVWFTDLIGQTD
jgi:hypothetical protein